MSYVSVDEAVNLLRSGQVVGVPTETVYGLAGRIDSEQALRAIFSTKQRPFFDPLIVHVFSAQSISELAVEWPLVFQKLANKFWPGPLTMVTRKTEAVSSLITSGLETVALRCPRHPKALEILQKLGVPFAAPSANRFGRTSPTLAEHVETEFSGSVPIVDGGPCEVGLESTVIDAHQERDIWKVRILRPGGVSRQELEHELESQGLNFTIERVESSASPGHLKTHYQPSNPVVILTKDLSDAEILARARKELGRNLVHVDRLDLGDEPALAARFLYQRFRELSQIENGLIVVVKTRTNINWEAIWDRIERASTLTLN